MCRYDITKRISSCVGSKHSTMRLLVVSLNSCTPCNQPDPDYSLLNTLQNRTDRVRLIAQMAKAFRPFWSRQLCWFVMILYTDLNYQTVGSLHQCEWKHFKNRATLMLPYQLMFENLTRQCQRLRHLDLSCPGLTGQIRAVCSTSTTSTITITIWHKKRNRLPILVPSTEFGKKACSK